MSNWRLGKNATRPMRRRFITDFIALAALWAMTFIYFTFVL